MGGREMEERGKMRVEHGCCHLEGWVAEGRENKSWSCVAAPVALKTDRDERSSSPVSVSSCRIDRAVVLPLLKSTEAIRCRPLCTAQERPRPARPQPTAL